MPCWSREELQDVLSDALSQPWSAEEEAVLGNELGMETVIDAVGRVNSLVKVCLQILYPELWLTPLPWPLSVIDAVGHGNSLVKVCLRLTQSAQMWCLRCLNV